jgi:hypothetical protein
MQLCPRCNSSHIQKRGTRNERQQYQCKDCRGWFSVSLEANSEVPKGYIVKGQSTLYDEDGKVKLTWEKVDRDKSQQFEMAKEAIKELAKEIKPLPPVPKPKAVKSDICTIYPLGDPHIGVYSYYKETGETYTLQDSYDLFTKAMATAIQSAPPSDECYIVNVGDFFHSDLSTNRTRSGNALDVSGRWVEVMHMGVRIVKNWVNQALLKHKTVNLVNAIGNHDSHSSLWLNIALKALYEHEPRVKVLDNEAQFQYFTFGKNLIGVTHGDTAKMADLGSIMASDRPKEWGDSRHRYWYTGHVHHDQVKEYRANLKVESFRSLCSKDSWHHAQGYRSDRDLKVLVLHKDHGEIQRLIFNITQFEAFN